MDENKYEITRLHIDSAGFDLLIIQLPETDIEDKLTYLAREKGLIRKSLYEDFIIATCIANINDLLVHLQTKGTDVQNLNIIRSEIVEKIIEVNRSLNPENLIINKNGVVKFARVTDTDATKLVDNAIWNNVFVGTDQRASEESDSLHKDKQSLDISKIKSIKDIPFVPVQKFWKRLNEYVTIKQFPEDSADALLGGRMFPTRSAFEQYIVTICIIEIEDLFVRLDTMGLPSRVSSHVLIHELFELCRTSNSFLDFNDCKCDTCEEDDQSDLFAPKQKSATDSEEEKSPAINKLFKNVPKETLVNLGKSIKDKVVGQDKAVDDIVDAIQRSSVGLKDPNQPLGSFIFAGYSGCGKTYTAKMLADSLIGSRKGLITIDCSEYASEHEYAKLIGAPSGYIGHEAGGYLTNAVRKQPFSVILFDEIEKANEKVHQLLLQIMDEARLTDGKGNPVSFKDTVIIMTSNVGVKEVSNISKRIGFGDANVVTDDKREKAIGEALKKKFTPEFLNRITSVVHFSSLTKSHYEGIIKLELEKIKSNLKLSGTDYSQIQLEFDDSLVDYIYSVGIDEKYGARPLKRSIEREISTPLARRLLNEDITEISLVKLGIDKDGLVIDIIKSEVANPPFYMNAGMEDE